MSRNGENILSFTKKLKNLLEDEDSSPQDVNDTVLAVEELARQSPSVEILAEIGNIIEKYNMCEKFPKMPLVYVLDSICSLRDVPKESNSIFFRILYSLPSKERVHLILKVIPNLFCPNNAPKVPLGCSEFFAELISACPSHNTIDSLGSEAICIVLNNPGTYRLDTAFVRSEVVWRILLNGLGQPGMVCLRTINALEHLLAFSSQTKRDLDCHVVVDGNLLFEWSEATSEMSLSFWQMYLTLFNSLETSHSAHVIDPFLAKVSKLFSAWSLLNISDVWLKLFCERATTLGNFSVSKRFMHELLSLDFVGTNPGALKFLPEILAKSFTEHRFFAIAHSANSPRQFLNGDSYSERLHPIFLDLCQLFRQIIYGSLPEKSKERFLVNYFDSLCRCVYSAPTLSFMLYSCFHPCDSDPAINHFPFMNNQCFLKFRELASSHMAASETEFKFLLSFSVVKYLIAFVDCQSVKLFDLMRFVDNLNMHLDYECRNFLLETLFDGLLNRKVGDGFSFEAEFEVFQHRLMEQTHFDRDESDSLTKFAMLLIKLCSDFQLHEKMSSNLSSFCDSILGKVASNPYLPRQRVLLCIDLISTANKWQNSFSYWARQCLLNRCEDVSTFFAAQLSNNFTGSPDMNYVWEKWANALSKLASNPYPCAINSLIAVLIEQFLTLPAETSATCSLAAFLICKLKVTNDIIPHIRRAVQTLESRNMLLEWLIMKNALPLMEMHVLASDLRKIVEEAEVLGTNAEALNQSFLYCLKIMESVRGNDGDNLGDAIQQAFQAIFNQVCELVQSAEPSWRHVYRSFIATFMRRDLIERFDLFTGFERVIEAFYAISQSRHEIWLALLIQLGKPECGLMEGRCQKIAVEILHRSLLFGPIGRRLRFFAESYYALRHLYALDFSDEKYVENFDNLVSRQLVSPAMIRVQAMFLLSPENKPPVDLIEANLGRLIAEHGLIIERTLDKRPFTNSQNHRDKHRCMLGIVYLLGNYGHSLKNRDLFEAIWQLCMVKILPKEIFNSVRYLTQWCVVLLLGHDNAENRFFDRLLEAYDKSVPQQLYSLMCCFIDIMSCYHFFSANIEFKEARLLQVFDRILPACLFNHFVTRARAQTALIRLWNTVNRQLVPSTFDSHFIQQCVAVANHELNKPVLRNLGNFFYRLKPSEDFKSLICLNFYLPKSCDLFIDEFAFRSDFEALKNSTRISANRNSWESYENQFACDDFQAAKLDDPDDLHVVVQENPNPNTGIIQRKLTNWRKLLPEVSSDDQIDSMGVDGAQPKTRPCSELILVASLIDKASNLGGLCRSADVFGLATVTLPSLDKIKDKEFESLAVSAHKWLKIIEVPPHHLTVFLLSLQREGYDLIAAEQATESVPLPRFKFPRKTALILGNEREGIPPHILQMVDRCVEIPQFGFAVRSLNVHVTGALFMYNYANQHATGNTTAD